MTSRPPDTAAALSLIGITRRFGHVTALDGATLHVRPGTVHALLGENGAGKSTLMRVAFGLVQANAGTMQLDGQTVRFASPSAALGAGLGMVHQHFTLVPAMSVAENVALGGHGLFSVTEWAARVTAIGQRTGLVLDPMARVGNLSVGAQQRCEIVKALARDVRVLILDEPTAVLAPSEAEELLRWVKTFARAGHAVVLITHKLRDALAIADDVTVLRLGKTVLSAEVADISESALAAAMLGPARDVASPDSATNILEAAALGAREARGSESLENGTTRVVMRRGARGSESLENDTTRVVMRLDNVTVRDQLGVTRAEDVSLAVRAGEIVGVAAVEGAGQREVLRLLSGRLLPTAGEATLPPRVGFVPEDRHNDALLLDRSLVENVALRDAGSRAGRMPWALLEDATRTIIRELQVRTGGSDAEARTLSGGNQQKLILGRELADQPEALVVENPTRGLDFRAARAVHVALRSARDAGTAIVVYSSDLDEVLALADRVVVMHAGQLSAVPSDREQIGRAMLGAPPGVVPA